MIDLLVILLIIVIVFGVLFYALGLVPMDARLMQLARLVLGVLFVLVLAYQLLPFLRVR